MAYPTYTVTDMATFTGRPSDSFPSPYVNQSIAQATLLFKLATCLSDFPSDSTQAELAKYAILSMADAFIVSQPYQQVNGSPFSSETIGSYSYSKATKALQAGTPTGISWFDIAVQQLGMCDSGGIGSSGIASDSIGVFEFDGEFALDSDGRKVLVGPADIDKNDVPFFISSDRASGSRSD